VKAEESKTTPVVKEETKPAEYKQSVVTHKEPIIAEDGVNIIFFDEQSNGIIDTIRILIPPLKTIIAETKEVPKEERKFLEISSDTVATAVVVPPVVIPPAVVDTKKTGEQPKVTPVATETKPVVAETSKPAHRNNCKGVATDKDFLGLRKKMAAETDDDDMVDEARKYFKTKCFTTQQMKNLSALFLDDLGKYKFFDLAYIFVSDIENFGSLASELKNDYYISRFKAMLK
jgi:hypothetical protein